MKTTFKCQQKTFEKKKYESNFDVVYYVSIYVESLMYFNKNVNNPKTDLICYIWFDVINLTWVLHEVFFSLIHIWWKGGGGVWFYPPSFYLWKQ